jgi:hypothetical protein
LDLRHDAKVPRALVRQLLRRIPARLPARRRPAGDLDAGVADPADKARGGRLHGHFFRNMSNLPEERFTEWDVGPAVALFWKF